VRPPTFRSLGPRRVHNRSPAAEARTPCPGRCRRDNRQAMMGLAGAERSATGRCREPGTGSLQIRGQASGVRGHVTRWRALPDRAGHPACAPRASTGAEISQSPFYHAHRRKEEPECPTRVIICVALTRTAHGSAVKFSGDRAEFEPPAAAPARDLRQLQCPTKAQAALAVAPRRVNSSASSSTEPNRRLRRSRT
jgi:hypothetical protein